jgi:hypothetical protein
VLAFTPLKPGGLSAVSLPQRRASVRRQAITARAVCNSACLGQNMAAPVFNTLGGFIPQSFKEDNAELFLYFGSHPAATSALFLGCSCLFFLTLVNVVSKDPDAVKPQNKREVLAYLTRPPSDYTGDEAFNVFLVVFHGYCFYDAFNVSYAKKYMQLVRRDYSINPHGRPYNKYYNNFHFANQARGLRGLFGLRLPPSARCVRHDPNCVEAARRRARRRHKEEAAGVGSLRRWKANRPRQTEAPRGFPQQGCAQRVERERERASCMRFLLAAATLVCFETKVNKSMVKSSSYSPHKYKIAPL